MQKQPDIEIFFFLRVSNSFWHPDENHTTGATNSFPRLAASPEQRKGKEPTENSVQQGSVRSSCMAWIIDPFLKTINDIAKTERGEDQCYPTPWTRLPDVAKLLAAEPGGCQPRQPGCKVPISLMLQPPIHRDTTSSPRSPGPAGLQGNRKSLLPLGQFLAAAMLQFYCRNPTEFYYSSMTSYLFLFLSIYAMPPHTGLLSELLLVLQPVSQQDALAPTAANENWCGWWSAGWWNRCNPLPHLSYGNTSQIGTNPSSYRSAGKLSRLKDYRKLQKCPVLHVIIFIIICPL